MPVPDVSQHPISELVTLRGRTAVVTGGGRGLGKAIAARLAEAGAHVLVGDIDGDLAGKTAAELAERYDTDAVGVTMDVTDSASVRAAADLAVDRWGRLDAWVNNAGVFPHIPVLEMTDEEWDAVFAVNARGTLASSREAARAMSAGGHGGVIVNVASTVAVAGIPDRAAYVASKGGVAALTRAMALDHVADNIRVNAVAPGVIWSNYYDRMMQQVPDPAAFKKGLQDRAPMGRIGEPKDIANAILFLASDESSFATGSVMLIDGGYTAR